MGGDTATLDKIRTHYDTLQVARDATPEVITAAYRALSRVHHPDRNVGQDEAEDAMATINASYAILSDPARRRVHDQWIAAQEDWELEAEDTLGWEVDAWDDGGAAQRRAPWRRQRSHLRRFGFGYALLGVAGAGSFFLLAGPDAQPSGLPPYDRSAERLATLADASAARQPPPPAQAATAKDADTGPVELDLLGTADEERARGGRDADPELARAPNGQSWPREAGYVPGYVQLRTDGLSNLLIDNRANENNMFLKLVAIDDDKTSPVRHVFVPARSSFTIEKIRAGQYDVRYQNLGNGALARSQPFELTEVERPAGTEYSNVTLTLYDAPGDTLDTFKLSAKEF